MTCTITYITSSAPGEADRTMARGTLPRRATRWHVRAWMISPDGEKNLHSLTVPDCTAAELQPLIGERIDALASEHGRVCAQFGWQACARGGMKKPHKGGKRR